MQIININLKQIIIEQDIKEEEIDKLIEDKGGIKLSKNNYTIGENKYKEIREMLK